MRSKSKFSFLNLLIIMTKKMLQIKAKLYSIMYSPIFIIGIYNSETMHLSGSKNNKFLSDCSDIAKDNNINNALIYVVKHSDGRKVIKTSGNISKGAGQRLRNVWSFYA
ncbi:DUF3634 family protein [Wenyingzhuangia sp. IMCC45574]